jgi:hypothetical protein
MWIGSWFDLLSARTAQSTPNLRVYPAHGYAICMTIPSWLHEVNPVWLALIATCFTWGVTALGAAMVFFFKTVDRRCSTPCSALPPA